MHCCLQRILKGANVLFLVALATDAVFAIHISDFHVVYDRRRPSVCLPFVEPLDGLDMYVETGTD
jgi:hypothetical protein